MVIQRCNPWTVGLTLPHNVGSVSASYPAGPERHEWLTVQLMNVDSASECLRPVDTLRTKAQQF